MSCRPATGRLHGALPILIGLLLIVGTAAAHAPLSVSGNEGIAAATLIEDPEKSFVLYTALNDDGDPQYYRFPLQGGQVLYGTLMIPGPGSSVPDLVLIGPGINASSTVAVSVPASVLASLEIPEGYDAMAVRGKDSGKPSYEPFTPQPVYEVARFNVTAETSGDYYVAVAGPGGAKYGLAPGYKEEFTAEEWLLIPASVIAIHLWEGQSPAYTFGPLAAVIIIGFALALLHRRKKGVLSEPAGWLMLAAGLLCLGGAAMTLLQVVHAVLRTGFSPAVLVTLMLVAVPVVLGLVAVRMALRPPRPDPPLVDAGILALVGALGLLSWAGLILGPLLAFAAAGLLFLRHVRARKAVVT